MSLMCGPPPTTYPEYIEQGDIVIATPTEEFLEHLRAMEPGWFEKNMLGKWEPEPYSIPYLSPTGRMASKPEMQRIKTHKPDTREHKMIPLITTETGRWMNPNAKFPMENPCAEVSLGRKAIPTLEGHKMYSNDLTKLVYDEDDGDIYLTQRECMTNPEIFFGPLSCSLSHLMKTEHYWMECRIIRFARRAGSCAKIRVYLTNGVVRYKVASTSWDDMQAVGRISGYYDLADHINCGVNLVRASSSEPKTVVVEKIVIDERDPFDVIQERYKKPARHKNPDVPLAGSNMTLKEEVRYQLTGKLPSHL